MIMDDINEKEFKTLILARNIYSDTIEMEFEHRKMCHAHIDKGKTINDGMNRTIKSERPKKKELTNIW